MMKEGENRNLVLSPEYFRDLKKRMEQEPDVFLREMEGVLNLAVKSRNVFVLKRIISHFRVYLKDIAPFIMDTLNRVFRFLVRGGYWGELVEVLKIVYPYGNETTIRILRSIPESAVMDGVQLFFVRRHIKGVERLLGNSSKESVKCSFVQMNWDRWVE